MSLRTLRSVLVLPGIEVAGLFMSPRFEALVVFGVTTILVSLFAWMYLRDRQPRTGLWMLGWLAILVHFAVPAFNTGSPRLVPFALWIKVCTLIIAGTCFLLS